MIEHNTMPHPNSHQAPGLTNKCLKSLVQTKSCLLGLTGNDLVRSCQEPIISDVQFFLGWNCFVRHPLFARTHFGHFCWQHLPSPRWLTKQETPEKCQFITFGKNIENLRPKIQVSLQRRTQSNCWRVKNIFYVHPIHYYFFQLNWLVCILYYV